MKRTDLSESTIWLPQTVVLLKRNYRVLRQKVHGYVSKGILLRSTTTVFGYKDTPTLEDIAYPSEWLPRSQYAMPQIIRVQLRSIQRCRKLSPKQKIGTNLIIWC